MLSSSYKKKCINFHKKLTEPLQLTVGIRGWASICDGCDDSYSSSSSRVKVYILLIRGGVCLHGMEAGMWW